MALEQHFTGTDTMSQFEAWMSERRHEGDEVAIKSYYLANRTLIVEYTIERVLREVGKMATGP